MASALEKAQARLAEAEQLAARWQAEHAAKQAEHTDLAARVGELALDDPSRAVGLAGDLARLTAEADVAGRAALAATARADQVRPQVLRAEAEVLRDRAAGKRAEAGKRQERTSKLLAELAEFEGVEFGVKAAPQEFPGVPWYPATRTARLLAEAAALESQAAQWEAQADGATPQVQASLVASLAGVGG